MAYTEKRKINRRTYYYRVISIRKVSKISKKRVYLGHDLSPSELSKKENKADEILLPKNAIKKNMEIKKIKRKIVRVLNKYNIKKAGIFGSYARGEQTKNSDIDIVVKIGDKKMSLFGFIRLKLQLENVLGKKVDLVEYPALKPLIRNRILNEEVKIL